MINNKQFSWDEIPTLLSNLEGKIEGIIKRLDKMQDNVDVSPSDIKMDITQLSHYIPGNPAVQTIYQWCSKSLIPYHKVSKRLFFVQSEIDQWLMSSKHKTDKELLDEAQIYINSKKTRR